MTLEQVIKELDMHFVRIDAILPELEGYLPLKESDFQEIEKMRAVDLYGDLKQIYNGVLDRV